MRLFFTILFLYCGAVKAQNMPLIIQFSEKITTSASIIDTVYSDTMQVITGSNAPSVSGWTVLSSAGSAPHSVIKTATVSGVTISTNNTSAWDIFGSTTANNTGGEDTDDGGGFFFPAAVIRTILFSYNGSYSGSTTDAHWKFSGLQADSIYVFEWMLTRDLTGAAKEGMLKVIDRDGVRDITTWYNGTQANRAGTNPSGNGVYYAGNTSLYVKVWATANSSGEIYFWGGGTLNTADANRFICYGGVRKYKASIRIH